MEDTLTIFKSNLEGNLLLLCTKQGTNVQPTDLQKSREQRPGGGGGGGFTHEKMKTQCSSHVQAKINWSEAGGIGDFDHSRTHHDLALYQGQQPQGLYGFKKKKSISQHKICLIMLVMNNRQFQSD